MTRGRFSSGHKLQVQKVDDEEKNLNNIKKQIDIWHDDFSKANIMSCYQKLKKRMFLL